MAKQSSLKLSSLSMPYLDFTKNTFNSLLRINMRRQISDTSPSTQIINKNIYKFNGSKHKTYKSSAPEIMYLPVLSNEIHEMVAPPAN